MKIKLNDDKVQVDYVRGMLRLNDGYCPCAFEKNEDSKCMCRDFREQDTPGQCHCGLYEKVED